MTHGKTYNKLSGSHYLYLEQVSMVQKMFESLTFNCTLKTSVLIDFIPVSNPKHVIVSNVVSPFIPDLMGYHSPVLMTLMYRKSTQNSFKRNI